MFETMDKGQMKEFVRSVTNSIGEVDETTRTVELVAREIAEQLVTNYDLIHKEPSVNRRSDPRTETRLKGFAQAIKEAEDSSTDIPESERLLEMRIWASDVMSLAYLLVTNEAHRQLETQLSKEGVDIKTLPLEEVLDRKADICVSFIEIQRRRTGEKVATENKKISTSGLEIEIDDPLAYLSNSPEYLVEELKMAKDMLSMKPRAEIITSSRLSYEMATDFYNELLGLSLDRLLLRIIRMEQEISNIQTQSRLMHEVSPPESGESLPVSEKDRELCNAIAQLINDLKPINPDTLLSPAEIYLVSKLFPSRTEKIGQISGAFEVKDEKTYKESVTAPSASIKTQLKDLLHAWKLGALEGNLGIHQTLSGVEITPEDPSFMDVLAMSISSGLNQILESSEEDDLFTGFLADSGEYIHLESHRKPSEINGEEWYIPGHRNRGVKPDGYVPYKEGDESLTELRLVGDLNKDKNFPSFVKQMTFNWLCAAGCMADQKDPADRDEDDQFLAQSWQELQNNWTNTLEKHSIKQPEKGRYMCHYSDVRNETPPEDYSGYVYKLAVVRDSEARAVERGEMKREDTLAYDTYKIMIEYRAKVRAKIREMEKRQKQDKSQ
jgi:hypothetical protein